MSTELISRFFVVVKLQCSQNVFAYVLVLMRFIQGKSLSYLVLQAEEQRERQPTIEKIAQYLLHCPLLTSLFNLHGDSILGIFGSEGGGGLSLPAHNISISKYRSKYSL